MDAPKSRKTVHAILCTVTPPRTPTALTTSAHKLLSEIQTIYDAVSSLSSLAPGEPLNTLLTRLVNLCIMPYGEDFKTYFLSMSGVQKLCELLRPLCAIAEGKMEAYWAHRLLREATQATNDPRAVLKTFPYYQNYIDLCAIESSSITPFLPTSSTPTNIAFIGSGPLPLTSICLLERYPEATVHNIDRDQAALVVSLQLCEKLGYADRMTFSCEDITQPSEYDREKFDVVFLAALVGTDTASKMAILRGLVGKLRAGALVVTRSSRGLKTLLYPVLEIPGDLAGVGLEVMVEVHPWTKVVNSVTVFRVVERGET